MIRQVGDSGNVRWDRGRVNQGTEGSAPGAEPSDTVSVGWHEKGKSIENSLKEGFKKLKERAEKTVDYLEKRVPVKIALEGAFSLFKTIKAFPKFIYPTVHNMKPEEADFVLDTLDKLPLKDVNSVKDIQMLQSIPNASGFAVSNPATPFIRLSREQAQISEKWAREVIIHEVGHTKDFDTALFGFIGFESKGSPWGKPPYISDYAGTNHWEDFAESYASYHLRPDKLKAEAPEKFAKIQELEKSGVMERLIDNQAFRETGKYMGKLFNRAPWIRSALGYLTYFMGFVQAFKGLGEVEKGMQTGDAKMKMDGALDIAAGACFASKVFSLAGIAIDGAKMELDRAISKKEITAEQGNAVAQATVGIVTGPLTRLLHWVESHLPWHKDDKPPAETPPPAPPPNVGSLTKAAGIAVGGATGATAGGFIGPYSGIMAGFALAGPVGGVLGLVVGALAGVYIGSRVGGKLGGLVGGSINKLFRNMAPDAGAPGESKAPSPGKAPAAPSPGKAPPGKDRTQSADA